MKIKNYLILLIFISFGFKQKDSTNLEINKKEKTEKIVDISEINAYKMLYENQKESNSAILKTIFYALGGLGTAIILTYGSSWWFNDKKVKDAMNDIDTKIENIKKSILTDLLEKMNTQQSEKVTEIERVNLKFKDDIQKKITKSTENLNSFKEKIRSDIKKENKDLTSNYQNIINSYNDNLKSQINGLKETTSEKFKVFSELIEKNEKDIDKKINDQSKGIERNILSHKAEISFLKGSYNIALKAFVDYAIFDRNLGYNWAFKYTSEEIFKCLDKVDFIYTDEIEVLDKLSEMTREEYPEITSKIEKLYKSKKIKKL